MGAMLSCCNLCVVVLIAGDDVSNACLEQGHRLTTVTLPELSD